MKKFITVGIDVGALYTKAVALRGQELLAHTIAPTGAAGSRAARNCFRALLENAGVTSADIRAVASTGYGRKSVPFADMVLTEITCHARGACFLYPRTETVIDIGGQDSKIILVSNGLVRDFAMNDRCAAGTGRFLEVMSQALGLPLAEMGSESLRARRSGATPIRINHTCTVFAESEVVSLLAKRRSRRQIILALHDAIAERILGMAHRFELGHQITLCGGVAKNRGVVDCLRRRLGVSVNVPPEPQIVGALGAALAACCSI